jgi:hypothetical protein
VLPGPLHAGNWHLVGDGVVFDTCDVTFDVLLRASDGDHPIVSFQHHFVPPPAGPNEFDAVAYEADGAGVAAAAVANVDQLVLRFSVTGAPTQPTLYVPNGDAASTHGRDPSLTLPK